MRVSWSWSYREPKKKGMDNIDISFTWIQESYIQNHASRSTGSVKFGAWAQTDYRNGSMRLARLTGKFSSGCVFHKWQEVSIHIGSTKNFFLSIAQLAWYVCASTETKCVTSGLRLVQHLTPSSLTIFQRRRCSFLGTPAKTTLQPLRTSARTVFSICHRQNDLRLH